MRKIHVKSDINTLIDALKAFSDKQLLAVSHFLKYKKLTHNLRVHTNMEGAIGLYEFLYANLKADNLVELVEKKYTKTTLQNYKSVLKEMLADSLAYMEPWTDKGNWLREALTADCLMRLGMPDEAHNKLVELSLQFKGHRQPEHWLYKAMAFATLKPEYWHHNQSLSLFQSHQVACELSLTLREAYLVSRMKELCIHTLILSQRHPLLRTEEQILEVQKLNVSLVLTEDGESEKEVSLERRFFFHLAKELACRMLGMHQIAYQHSLHLVQVYKEDDNCSSFDLLMPNILYQLAVNGLNHVQPNEIKANLKYIIFDFPHPAFKGLEIELLRIRLLLANPNPKDLIDACLLLQKALNDKSASISEALAFETQFVLLQVTYALGKLREAKQIMNSLSIKKNFELEQHIIFDIGIYISAFLDLEIAQSQGKTQSETERTRWQQRYRSFANTPQAPNLETEYALDRMLCKFLAADHSSPSSYKKALQQLKQNIAKGFHENIPQLLVANHSFNFQVWVNKQLG